MDKAQKILFGRFPRSVGVPDQHIVHSEQEFDEWAETVLGKRNAYSSLSWFEIDGTPWSDKISFDLDSAGKEGAFEEELLDDAKIERIRQDVDVAEEVLGTVCEEARELTRALQEDGIPVIGVFSGFGLHIHALFQPERNPGAAMGTTVRKYREELGLVTVDEKPIGDVERIMRVPNMKRVAHEKDHPPYFVQKDCSLWTIPLTADELSEITPEELLGTSISPRRGTVSEPSERPEMEVYEDYTRTVHGSADVPEVVDGVDLEDEGVEWYLRELLKMPCMYENLIGDPEPPHEVRMNSAVLLFNIGMTPPEVADLMARLGWRDFDRETTLKHLEHVYEKGYADMNCQSIQEMGYCTRADDPVSCPAHGWSGGEAEWI